MSKWGLTADIQFDEYSKLSTLGESGLTSRLTDGTDCFTWVVDECKQAGCKGLIVCGDIFNSRTSIPLPVLHAVAGQMAYARSILERLILMVGNHDSYLRDPRINSLSIFAQVATVIREARSVEKFGFVPWTEDIDSFRAGVNRMAKDSTVKFLFSHVLVEGAVPSGKGWALRDLKPTKFKHVFLGDVHRPMSIGKNVTYIGSPMQIDYRDAGETRGFIIFDDQTGAIEFMENTLSPRFHLVCPETPVSALRNVGREDFIRIEGASNDAASFIQSLVEKKPGITVEDLSVSVDEIKPRISVESKDSQETVLRRYCEYVGVEDSDRVVKAGMAFLEAAK